MRVPLTLALAAGLALASLGTSPEAPERDPSVRVLVKPPRRAPDATAMDPLRRVLACQRLAEADSSAATEALVLLLRDSDPLVRSHAAQALGRHRGPLALAALTRALGSPDRHVRRCAAQALGVLGDPSVAPTLRRLASCDPDPGVRCQSAATLLVLGGS